MARKKKVLRAPAGRAETRETAKQETRQALVQAAMACFAEQGLDAPSLDAICERAGFTRGAFYVHFQSRDELIAAVMEQVRAATMDLRISTGDAAEDFINTVRAFAAAVASGNYPNFGAVRIHQFLGAVARSSLIRERHVAMQEQLIARLESLVRRGQGAKSLRTDVDPAHVATLLIAIVGGLEGMIESGLRFDVIAATETLLALLAPVRGRK